MCFFQAWCGGAGVNPAPPKICFARARIFLILPLKWPELTSKMLHLAKIRNNFHSKKWVFEGRVVEGEAISTQFIQKHSLSYVPAHHVRNQMSFMDYTKQLIRNFTLSKFRILRQSVPKYMSKSEIQKVSPLENVE